MRLHLSTLAGLCLLLSWIAVGQGKPPNLLIITVDNLGYGDLPSYNPESQIKTPQLDRFAKEGIRLTSFYTGSPTCTVSRACLLTGRVAQRHGLVRQLPGVAGNYGQGLNPRETLLSQVLRTRGYVTGCFGKWNIGFAEGSRPTERGFDEFVGHASGNMDYYRHNYRDQHDLYQGTRPQGTRPLHRPGEYATDIFAEAASKFIHQHSQADQPWFCYVPFNAPHFPVAGNKPPGELNRWQAPDWAFEVYGYSPSTEDYEKRYAAVVTAMDRGIGQVLKAVEAAGVAENTFVFLMSDNGAFRLGRKGLDIGRNDPLRSGGVTCWEGGLRVVAMARWPKRIRPGTVTNEPLWAMDLFPTCVALASAALPRDVKLDGHNLLPVLSAGAPSPHRSFFFAYRKHAALRMDDWKIVRESPEAPWGLFDLSKDREEQHDLAGRYPKKVQRLTREFQRWESEFE